MRKNNQILFDFQLTPGSVVSIAWPLFDDMILRNGYIVRAIQENMAHLPLVVHVQHTNGAEEILSFKQLASQRPARYLFDSTSMAVVEYPLCGKGTLFTTDTSLSTESLFYESPVLGLYNDCNTPVTLRLQSADGKYHSSFNTIAKHQHGLLSLNEVVAIQPGEPLFLFCMPFWGHDQTPHHAADKDIFQKTGLSLEVTHAGGVTETFDGAWLAGKVWNRGYSFTGTVEFCSKK